MNEVSRMYDNAIMQTVTKVREEQKEKEDWTANSHAQVIVIERYGETTVEDFKTMCQKRNLAISPIVRSLMEACTKAMEDADEAHKP